MDTLGLSPGDLAALIVAVSFAAGLNVYATVLTLGVLARVHWVVLPGGLEVLANPWIIGASAALFAGEFVADKIPGVDLVWNALHTFVRVPVAALLAYAATSHLSPEAHLVATCAGGLLAMLAHGSKTALRAVVTPSPEPASNIALSSAEDVGAIGISWVAMHHPVAAGVSLGVLSLGLVWALWATYARVRAALTRSWSRLREAW